MGTFSRSWDLISESFQVIRKDKKLIVFPILLVLAARTQPLLLGVALFYFLMLGAFMSAMKGIFAVALYRYATQGEAPAGFSKVNLNGAFVDISNRD
jgi:hypothetical protein